jgi:hypothetical protein
MGYPDAGVFIAPASLLRWRWDGARMGHPDAGVSIALASLLRWRFYCAGAGQTLASEEEPKRASLALAFPMRWRVRDTSVG